MWLDRFSGQSTPSGASTPSRPFSPGPRKSSHLAPAQRTGLGLHQTRSSTSLDLSANTSTTSLLSPPKNLNGSSLRYEQKPPPDVKDPHEVLRSILGIGNLEALPIRTEGDNSENVWQEAQKLEFQDHSLEEFLGQQLAEISEDESTRRVPQSLARDSRQKYQEFHNSISECDEVLRSVETYLTNFKAELGQVSAEIENLQARSVQLNAKLDNRRNVEKLLGPAVEDISIAPSTVRAVAEGPIDDTFVKALNEVDARSAILDAKVASSEQFKALEDVKPLLDDLKAKAVERIRDYVVSQIKALRSPNINAQVIQQQTFLRYKDLYSFLARNHAVLGEEISQAYINTMKWYYSSNFGRYQQSLGHIPLYTLDQHDLLGADSVAGRRNVLSGQKGSAPQQDPFGLGKRADVLKSNNDTAIPAHLAEDSKTAQYLEVPFRSFNQALIDNVCVEYSLATELFSANSYQQVSRKVVEMFESTFTLGHNLTKQLVESTTDCLGVLLCVRLNQHFAFELQRRKVPVADSYINYTNILLWPRFQMIMDLHCESLKRVPTSTNRGAVAAFSLVGGNDASRASVAPHPITQRFGQFLHGILALSTDAGDDEPLSNSLGRLRTEYESLMGKLAKGAGDASKRGRFLYNNYSLVLTIISDTQGKSAGEQKEHFGSLIRDMKTR